MYTYIIEYASGLHRVNKREREIEYEREAENIDV